MSSKAFLISFFFFLPPCPPLISLPKRDHVLTDTLHPFFARSQKELELGILGQAGFQGGLCPAGWLISYRFLTHH